MCFGDALVDALARGGASRTTVDHARASILQSHHTRAAPASTKFVSLWSSSSVSGRGLSGFEGRNVPRHNEHVGFDLLQARMPMLPAADWAHFAVGGRECVGQRGRERNKGARPNF